MTKSTDYKDVVIEKNEEVLRIEPSCLKISSPGVTAAQKLMLKLKMRQTDLELENHKLRIAIDEATKQNQYLRENETNKP